MSPLDVPKRSTVQILLVVAVGLLCLWQFHIPQFASNFDTFPGDRGDARLVTYLMEHWYRVFQGLENWRSPGMFYPVEGTIGYADLLLGYGIVYSILRTFGLGIFEAAEFTIILVNFLNYLVCFVLLNKVFRFNLFASIAGAAFFAFNSPKLLQMNHVQLQPMLFLPLALIGIVLLVQKRNTVSQKQAFGLIALSGISLAFQLMTGFYVGWFFIFWSSLFVVLTLLFKSTRNVIFDLVRKFWRPLMAGLAAFTVLLIPFIMTYLPIIRSAGGRPYEDIQQLIPVPRSFLLMGERNYLWGELSAFLESKHPVNLELRIGIGLIPTVAWIGLVVFAVWFLIRARNDRRTNYFFVAQLVIATSLVYVLGTKYCYDFSPWQLVYYFVPGGQAIRGVARYALVLALPMAIAFTFLINFVIEQIAPQIVRRRAILFALFVLTGFGLAEQFSSRYGFDGFSIKAENVYLNRAAQSFPNDCSSFYVAVKPTALHHQFEYQLDAMFISLIKGAPTLNGYSGQWPSNWHLWDVKDPAYENKVKSWVDERQLKGNVCRVFINETTAPHDIADMDVFIRQEYLDVLGREPDPGGFQWWLARLNGCGANCDRVDVALGILDSDEFRDRSYFVLRLYLAVLGRLPSQVEFNRDRAAIVSASTNELDSKKDALIGELVQHKTPAHVVRAVIENPQTVSAFRNQAFVLMQFFAHLNRDPYPNEYKRRLKNLERTGNRRGLVNDFLYSPEYRKRFGYVN